MASQYVELPTSGGGGVSSLNTLTGAITLAAGTGITITPAGNILTVASTGTTAFPILAPNGTVSAPSYSFSAETGLGFYKVSGGELGVTVGGALVFDFTSAVTTSFTPLKIRSAFALVFNNSADTFSTSIKAGVNLADYTITLPAAAPGTNKVLEFDGTNYVWATANDFSISTIASNTSAVVRSTYLCNTSGGAFNLTLPTPALNAFVRVKDSTGSFNTNNLTVVRNGSEQIEGIAASRILNSNWSSVVFISDGTNWFML